MIVNKELANSKGCDQKDLWATPIHIFAKLDKEFRFTLDPCAEEHTAKCDRYYTEEDNGLRCWDREVVFMNPPYSRGNIDKWVEWANWQCVHATVVGLLPVSTSSDWWHKWIVGKAELRFVNKRIKFEGAPYTAPFSSVIVIWGRSGISSFNQTNQAG